MTPAQFLSTLYVTKHSTLGITSLAVTSSSDAGSVFMVAFASGVSSAIFLTRVAGRFPDYVATLSNQESLTLGDLCVTPVSSAPGRCYFSVSYALA